MKELSVEVSQRGQQTDVVFSGTLDESAATKMPGEIKGKEIAIDLYRLSYISSFGADVWLRWLKSSFEPDSRVLVKRAPPCFVRVLNIIPSLIPIAWEIESFYVPYVSVTGKNSENVLFEKGKHFTEADLIIPPLLRSEIDNQRLEPDVHPARYFRFLWNRFENIKIKTIGS